jgi:hypothetical protein
MIRSSFKLTDMLVVVLCCDITALCALTDGRTVESEVQDWVLATSYPGDALELNRVSRLLVVDYWL